MAKDKKVFEIQEENNQEMEKSMGAAVRAAPATLEGNYCWGSNTALKLSFHEAGGKGEASRSQGPSFSQGNKYISLERLCFPESLSPR